MSLSDAMRISSTGLTAERFRLDVVSSNLANANTGAIGGAPPYRRRLVELEGGPNGVKIVGVVPDMSPFHTKVDWGDPNHNPKTGLVETSNVQPIAEMVDMLSASRAYQANISAFNSAKSMVQSALSIGKV